MSFYNSSIECEIKETREGGPFISYEFKLHLMDYSQIEWSDWMGRERKIVQKRPQDSEKFYGK